LICAASHGPLRSECVDAEEIARDAVRTDAIGVLTLNARLGFLAGVGVFFSATGKQASHTQGKSRSRLNALKHGILASQAVLTAIEGREERAAFEQLVDGLAHDFVPAGTFEQALVQRIAVCLWRQRRLLMMFENRAAFESRENRTYREMNEHERGLRPIYEQAKRFSVAFRSLQNDKQRCALA
jgi:hypothetical protein